MAGAGKKRNKAERQSNQSSNHGGVAKDSHKAAYDGPSERPGSSAGPGPASSRGRPPSQPPGQPTTPGPMRSTRSSSRPPSAGGPAQSVRSSSRPPTAAGPPLRDPALDPSRRQPPVLNPRIEWGGNAFNYYSDEAVRKSYRGGLVF